jgi:Cdc6-like AAA superfamily ATPase
MWQQGTGQHFLDSKAFLNWANENNQTLWFRGIPGAGKTILALVVIKHLKDAQREKEPANKAGVACLYCEHGRQKDQTPHSLLAAVLRQLADQRTLLPESVIKLHCLRNSNKILHNFGDIFSVLPDVIRSFPEVFLVVDALDECSEQSRRELLSNLRDLQNKTGMKLLAKSRLTVNFRKIFEECAKLEIEANKRDFIAVLDGRVEGLPACVRTDSVLWNKVKEDIAKAVDGM